MTTKAEIQPLARLRDPFPENQISKLPKPTKQQTEAVKADFKKGVRCKVCGSWHHPDVVHLDYVGHAALTDRLLDVDPHWSWEPMGYAEGGLPAFDRNGGLWIKLTICGITRPGYGSADGKNGGDAVKEIIGDALRNAAMRFGAALDLWHKGDLHTDEETSEGSAGGPAEGQSRKGELSPGGSTPDSRWAELVQLIEATNTNVGKLLQFYNAPDLDALTEAQADHAKKALKTKLAEMAAAAPNKQNFGELLDDEIPEFAGAPS